MPLERSAAPYPPYITLTCVSRGCSPSAIAGSAAPLGIKSTPFHATPQARQGAASWTDPGGRLWMFGGNGHDADGTSITFGDLWRLNPQSSGWSLIAASGSAPAARAYATSWADANGDLWLFGGKVAMRTAPPRSSMICGNPPYRPVNGIASAALRGGTCRRHTDSQVSPPPTVCPAADRTPLPGSIQPARSGCSAATASTPRAHSERSAICGNTRHQRACGPRRAALRPEPALKRPRGTGHAYPTRGTISRRRGIPNRARSATRHTTQPRAPGARRRVVSALLRDAATLRPRRLARRHSCQGSTSACRNRGADDPRKQSPTR